MLPSPGVCAQTFSSQAAACDGNLYSIYHNYQRALPKQNPFEIKLSQQKKTIYNFIFVIEHVNY